MVTEDKTEDKLVEVGIGDDVNGKAGSKVKDVRCKVLGL